MRILILTPDFPIPVANATRQRAYHLVRLLGRRHEIHLLTFHEPECPPCGEEIEALQDLGSASVDSLAWRKESALFSQIQNLPERVPHAVRKFRVPAFHRRLRQLLRLEIDVVHCDINMYEMLQWLTGQEASVAAPCDSFTRMMLKSVRRARTPLRRIYSLMQAAKYWYVERRLLPRFTKCQVVSEAEATFLKRINPSLDVAVVPIGAEVRGTGWRELERKPSPDIVISGEMRNPFTADSVIWFIRSVWPTIRSGHPAGTLRILGRGVPRAVRRAAASDPRVVVTGFVEDLPAEVRKGIAYVCPLRYGVGMKTRVLEAMGSGVPLVTTSVGAEGIGITHGEHALVADTADALAQQALRLLREPDTRRRLAEAAHSLVDSRLRWEHYADGMERLYEDALRTHMDRVKRVSGMHVAPR
jgi:glycosyltransferase involved in cell wall biosynthesis